MKNADIYINGERAVYDEKTLVGTILRNFDFTDPTNRKQAYTNSIKLPVMENQHIFDFASEPGYSGSVPYTRVSVEIIVDGYLLLKDGIGYLDSIQDGYYILSIREQPDLIQTMKDRNLSSPLAGSGPYAGNAVQTLINATSGMKIDFFINEQTRLYSVGLPARWRLYRTSGNFSAYVHSIFSQVGVLDSITFAGSLMTDASFLNLRVVVEKACFENNGGTYTFSDVDINSKKSFFDLFKAVLQKFGAVYTVSGSTVTIDRYDDLTLTKVDWSGKLQKVISKKFRIPNLAQNNYMRFKTGGDAEEKLNESVWTCNNKNIEFEGTIISPDEMVYPFISLVGLITGFSGDNDKAINLPNSSFNIRTGAFPSVMTASGGITDLVLVVDGSINMPIGRSLEVEHTIYNGGVGTSTWTSAFGDNLAIAAYYNSQGDYATLAAMLADPVMYEVEIDLDVLDLHDYDPFNLPIIPELAGEFYQNRVQYNFEKRGKASKATLIKYIEP